MSDKAEFIAVYGRRRVGKTFLIRQYFNQKECYFFQLTGLKNDNHQKSQSKKKIKLQLHELRKELEKTFYQVLKHTQLRTPQNWHEAFEMIQDGIELISKLENQPKKIVLFFDELPWMATPKSGLLEAIDYFWNRFWVNNPNIILVVCGSSSSWIIEKVLNNRGGLHNRVTLKMPIKTFCLQEVEEFLKTKNVQLNREQIIQIYMAMGGIPYYLNNITPGLSASQVITTLCFHENGILRNEFDNLYAALFSEADAYIELVRLIASKSYGIARTDLIKKIKLSQKGGTLTKRLLELEQSGFISKIHNPYKKRQIMYQCVDEYTLFYLKWIEPSKNLYIDPLFWQSVYHTPDFYAWAGVAFEVLCYKHINQIIRALNIPPGAIAYAWRCNNKNNNAQIDLVFERSDGVIHLCEIKYTNQPYAIDKNEYEEIVNRIRIYSTETKSTKQIFVSLISLNGIKATNYSGIIVSTAVMDDLFSF